MSPQYSGRWYLSYKWPCVSVITFPFRLICVMSGSENCSRFSILSLSQFPFTAVISFEYLFSKSATSSSFIVLK